MMRKKKAEQVRHFCRECAHAYDHHSMSLAGNPILCRCKFQKFCMLLNWDCCEHFKPKLNEKAKIA